MVGIVYRTINLANGKIYIGQRECSEDKFDGYFGSGTLILRALKKYGKENFKRETLRVCETFHEMDIWEHYYIKLKKAQDPNIGYNIASGNPCNTLHNPAKLPEARKRFCEINKGENNPFYGKEHSEETKKIMSEKGKNRCSNPKNTSFYGKHHTEESRQKISQGNLGRKRNISDIVRFQMSKKKRGFQLGTKAINNGKVNKWLKPGETIPEGFVYGIINAHGFKGKHHTEESKKKLSKKRKDTKLKEETKQKMSESGKNKIWITNGVKQTKIKKDAEIPEGWWRGRTKKKGA